MPDLTDAKRQVSLMHSSDTRAGIWWRRGYTIALMIGLSCFAAYIGWLLEQSAVARHVENQRQGARQVAAVLGQRLAAEVNGTVLLANGMAAFISANPGLRQDEFETIATSLLAHRTQALNFSVARGTTISYVYPVQSGRALVGLDYRKIDEQWAGVQRVIETRQSVVDGPYELVQGGQAIIARTPVLVRNQAGESTVWGLVSVPIPLQPLLRMAGLLQPGPLSFALRNVSLDMTVSDAFFGREDVFSASPALVGITLQGASWQLAAMPKDGWEWPAGIVWTYRLATLAVIGFICLAAYLLVRDIQGVPFRLRTGSSVLRGQGGSGGGLLSRRGLIDLSVAEFSSARRHGRPIAALMIEIDGYAGLLSAVGVTGMAPVLEQVGAACESALRPSDAVAHFDGGCYAALLPGAGRDGAVMAGDRVRRAVKALNLKDDEGESLTVSVGVVTRGDGGADDDLEGLLARAASRLAEGRRSGADCVAA